MKNFIITILLLAGGYAHAQEYFYNKHWQRTSKKKEYAYKRMVNMVGETTYEITDYYYRTDIYMKGTYLTTQPEYLADYRSTLYRHDTFTYYYPNGSLKAKGKFLSGYRHGEWLHYHNDGTTIEEKAYYTHGKKTGTWEKYDRNGQIDRITTFNDDGLPDKAPSQRTSAESPIFRYVEQMPEPGYNINEYLGGKIKYPPSARKMRLQGRAKINFVVDTDGYITDVESISPETDILFLLEAIRVVQMMPPWKPGSQNGQPVKVYYTLPINFKLPGK